MDADLTESDIFNLLTRQEIGSRIVTEKYNCIKVVKGTAETKVYWVLTNLSGHTIVLTTSSLSSMLVTSQKRGVVWSLL